MSFINSLFALRKEQVEFFLDLWDNKKLMKQLNIDKKQQLKRLVMELGLNSFKEKYIDKRSS
jgi:hypothetical protein